PRLGGLLGSRTRRSVPRRGRRSRVATGPVTGGQSALVREALGTQPAWALPPPRREGRGKRTARRRATPACDLSVALGAKELAADDGGCAEAPDDGPGDISRPTTGIRQGIAKCRAS